MSDTAIRPEATEASAPGERPGRSRRWWGSGWIPFALAVVATTLLLAYYGVPVGDTAAFAGYSLGCVTLPGLLLWRAVQGRSGYLAFDAAAGTAVGFAVEVPVYLLARHVNAPLTVLAWPALTIVAFLAVPTLRRHWAGDGRRLPAGVSWSLLIAFAYILAISGEFFRAYALAGPTVANEPNPDLSFQIALTGQIRSHAALVAPWVDHTQLHYQWFVYAHGAAASWITGIDPRVLVLRLLPLTMVAALFVMIVAIAWTITRRWWPGPLALLLILFGTAASPLAWTGTPTFTGTILDNIWASETQSFAAVLFAAVVLVIITLFRNADRRTMAVSPADAVPADAVPSDAMPADAMAADAMPADAVPSDATLSGKMPSAPAVRRWGSWIAFTVLIGVLSGSKATYVPMLLGGLVLALVVHLVLTRRPGPALPAIVICGLWLVFAQFVLYGGQSYGMVISPLQTSKWTVLGMTLMGPPTPVNHPSVMITVAVLSVVGCAFAWVGMLGLLRRGWRTDPALLTMLGFSVAGVVATYAFAHPGLSQTYFARAASPYLALLAAIGFAALLPATDEVRARRVRAIALSVVAAALGVAVLYLVRESVGHTRPPRIPEPNAVWHAVLPYVALGSGLVVVAALIAVAGRLLRIPAGAVVAAAAVAFLLPALVTGGAGVTNLVRVGTSGPLRNAVAAPATIPVGAVEAGLWLNAHSATNDLVATNSHCRRARASWCDSRDFWLAAFSQRQVLVEGWSYTDRALDSGPLFSDAFATSPFWDPALLARNDAVFYQPTAQDVASFATETGVRWLVAVGPNVSPALGTYASLRYHAGAVSIYQVSPGR
jgi:hypothetical protein